MRADTVYLTWLSRRRVWTSVAAMLAGTVLAAFLPDGIATPQLRGAALVVGPQTFLAFAMGMCIVPVHFARDALLEERSPRLLGVAKVALGIVLLVISSSLAASVVLVAGGTGLEVLSAIRTVLLSSAIALGASRFGGLATAFSAVLAYLGCCLFAGAKPDGAVELWARPLAVWETSPDLAFIVTGGLVYLVLFTGRGPLSEPR